MKELFKILRDKMKYFIIVILLGGINCLTFSQSQKLNSNQATPNDNEIVVNFMKPLNVVIPDKWISFAVDAIKLLDNEGIASAHMILQEDLPKVPIEDRPAYVLMAFDAIRTAYDKEKHTTAADSEDCLAVFITYENEIKSITNRFAQDFVKRSEEIIAQNNQTIERNNQTIEKDCYASEQELLKLYRIAPDDKETKDLAERGKKIFDKYNYKYSAESTKMFEALGIK